MEPVMLLLWTAIGFFLLGVFPVPALRKRALHLSAVGWLFFGAFWLARLPIYLETNSGIKIVLSVLALPMSAYVAYQMVTKERDTLLKLSQAVAAMGLVYMPFLLIDPLHTALIEHTAAQTNRILSVLGIDAQLTEREGIHNLFVVTNPATGEEYRTYIILACTGIGSMAIFAGLISAIDAPLRRKMMAFAVSIPVIYALNLVRNVFIATAYGYQWFPYAESFIVDLTGKYEGYASFFWADKVISQGLSVVVLVAILFAVIRFLPELTELLDEILDLLGISKKKA
ncbi:MAG: archaeosortase A [Halobacteriales archaeon]|nr:archaeosortase A [Halobacteriales archaeon]